jgi:precorrin-8X/cobalt-precorrin-8 methylmutase
MQIAIVPVYLFTGVLIERIQEQVTRLKQQYPQIAFALGTHFGFDQASSRCSTPRWPATPCPRGACSNATAANTAPRRKKNTCTTTAIPPSRPGRRLRHGHTTTPWPHTAAHTHTTDSRGTHAHPPPNTVTEQLTAAGRAIEHDSFAIIDAEAGPHAYTAEQWPLVRRMIHANADFEFNGLTAFHPDAMQAGMRACWRHAGGGRCGDDLRRPVEAAPRPLRHDHPPVHLRRRRDRGRQGRQPPAPCRPCARPTGSACWTAPSSASATPTALIELVRLIREEGVRPALVIGMPVGFVSAAESKDLLMTVNEVPWVAIQGRKGGSTLVVAAIHAMLSLAEAEQKGGLSQQ